MALRTKRHQEKVENEINLKNISLWPQLLKTHFVITKNIYSKWTRVFLLLEFLLEVRIKKVNAVCLGFYMASIIKATVDTQQILLEQERVGTRKLCFNQPKDTFLISVGLPRFYPIQG